MGCIWLGKFVQTCIKDNKICAGGMPVCHTVRTEFKRFLKSSLFYGHFLYISFKRRVIKIEQYLEDYTFPFSRGKRLITVKGYLSCPELNKAMEQIACRITLIGFSSLSLGNKYLSHTYCGTNLVLCSRFCLLSFFLSGTHYPEKNKQNTMN